MISKTIMYLLLVVALFPSLLFAVSPSTTALINQNVFDNPEIERLNRSVTMQEWGIGLFANGISVGYGYVMPPSYELLSAVSFHLDNTWN